MVLLVTPNAKGKMYGVTAEKFSAIQPNIYMAILDSYLNNIKSTPCDMLNLEAENMTNAEGVEYIANMKPSKVVIICSGSNPSASTSSMVGAIDLCQQIKKKYPGQHIALYGGHPTVLPERSLKETGADEVWMGDCLDCNINDIPMIDWKRIDPTKYRAHNWHCLGNLDNRSPYGVIWTSLGCPYSCSFCCINNLFMDKPYRLRSMEKVIEEIDFLVKEYNIRHIKIMDELFVTPHPRIDLFCDLLEERNYNLNMWCFSRVDTIDKRVMERLKKVGMNWIAYGFESVNEDILKSVDKRVDLATYDRVIQETKDADINIIADVIVGFPDDDLSTLTKTEKWIKEKNFEFLNLYPLFAFPGTEAFRKCDDWSEYSIYGPSCKPEATNYLASEVVTYLRDQIFNNYISDKNYLTMIENKFGERAVQHMMEMSKIKLNRKLLDMGGGCAVR